MVSLEVVTYPSLHQPLLKVEVSKRRWFTQLKAPKYDRRNISGFIFSQDYPDRAFSYQVKCKQDKNNEQDKKNWRWVTDTDFEILRRELKLPLESFDGQQIALGKASTDEIRCVVNGSGRRHDYKLFVDSKVRFHPETESLEDSGYQGISKLHRNCRLPKKKPKKGKLTPEDKHYNRYEASRRKDN